MKSKSFPKKMWDLLGSRNLSVFIFVMGMAYTAVLLVFSFLVPLRSVEKISVLFSYQFLYLLLFINLLICLIKWLPVVLDRCRKMVVSENDEDLKRFHRRLERGDSDLRFGRLAKSLKMRGYRVKMLDVDAPEKLLDGYGRMYAYRGRFSPLGTLFFHLSFLFILGGVILGMHRNLYGTVILGAGQEMTGSRGQYLQFEGAGEESYPEISFRVGNVTPEFWEDELLFTDLRADIASGDTRGGVRLSKPMDINGADVTIIGMGITPEYSLKNREGEILDNGYVNLNNFMPGSKDWFQIPGYPFKFNVSFFSDYQKMGNKIVSRSMNPINPIFLLEILVGEKALYKGLLKPGDEIEFEGYRFSFPQFNYGGLFRVVNIKGTPLVWTGLIMMCSGLIWRFIFFRKEIIIFSRGEGTLELFGSSEYYPKLFGRELEYLADSA